MNRWKGLSLALLVLALTLGFTQVAVAADKQDCTPGYWKNHLDVWPEPYDPEDDFDDTFWVDYFEPNITLEEALRAKGGGVNRLARHGTAALLNAAHPEVNYLLAELQAIARVIQGTHKTQFLENNNEAGCPL